MPGTGKLTALALCLLMVLSTLPLAMSPGHPEGPSAGRAAVAGDVWVAAGTFEKDIEVQKGERFFASIGADGNLTPVEVPAQDAGMTPQVLSAIDRAPDWMRTDLLKKLRELAVTPLDEGSNTRMALGDVDGDGLREMVTAFGYYLSSYENIGTPAFPLFKYNMSLGGMNSGGPLPGLPIDTPALGDLNGDGKADLVVGCGAGGLDYEVGRDMGDLNVNVPGPAAPALCDLDNDGDLDLVVGDGAGKIQYFENTGNRTDWTFQKTATSALFGALVVPAPAVPSLADLDGDGDMDLAAGGGNGVVHYFRNLGTRTAPAWAPDDPTMFSGLLASGRAAPCLAKLDGDDRTDLCLGQTNGPVLYYMNIGTSGAPKWQTWPFYDYTPSVAYYPPNEYVTYLNLSIPWRYILALLTVEDRCVDELAFSIAHSAVEALRESSPDIYVENARSLYENDQYIPYAQIIDCANYSTVRYAVNESGKLNSYELPRDIYYWYIVHPKITDEMPLYIDPDEPSGSANESAQPPDGKFWRNYIFFNADPAYPPDPATDANGDGVPDFHYPKTMTPPLLKDLLAGVRTMWNCTAYNSPAGFDNAGINNSHPFDYGDHAIEKVSNWVMKTLPLNEQESADGERPIQPVRLFHHHNGNCGELGDLTVAAARAALIPAVQVSMLGEDHVWIEFYERGWHQWDNYWSDSGSVIDNFMNYWAGWGRRGGSGISGWRGDDHEFEVTSDYIPPPAQSHVTVNVRDSAGYPVDGARVVMMSHWMAESQQPRTGMTYPFPAIWNYTDGKGSTTFVLAHNNFTIEVTSKLGRAVENKTYIGEGKVIGFNFTLPGRLPSPLPRAILPPAGPVGNVKLDYAISIKSGEQRPPNPEVMTTAVQPVSTGLSLYSFVCDAPNLTQYLSGNSFYTAPNFYADETNGRSGVLPQNGTWYLVLSNENMLETSKAVRLKMKVFILHRTPSIVIDYPADGAAIDISRPVPATGRIIGEAPVGRLELSVDNGVRQNMTSGLDRLTGRWRWDADMGSLSSGLHKLTVTIFDDLGLANSTSVLIIADRYPPKVSVDSPAGGALFDLDTILDFRGRASDDLGIKALQYRMDGGPAVDITGSLQGQGWYFTVPGGVLGGGTHDVEVKAIDPVGKSGLATASFELQDATPPELRITAPADQEVFQLGSTVIIRGTVRDDSGIAALALALDGRSMDLRSGIGPSGEWSYSWNTLGRTDAGDVSFSVSAADRLGNRASAGRTIRLVDGQAPSVTISQPANGTLVALGSWLNVSGTAGDDIGVVRLDIRVGDGGWRSIIGTLRDGRFRCFLDLAGLAAGRCNITVRALDASGNTATDRVYINLEGPQLPKPGPREAQTFIPGMGLAALVCAIGALSVARRMGKARD